MLWVLRYSSSRLKQFSLWENLKMQMYQKDKNKDFCKAINILRVESSKFFNI